MSNLPQVDTKEVFILPEKYVEIENGAFFGRTYKVVILHDKVKCIGAGAFSNSRLVSIVIPKGVKSIGNNVFLDCVHLEYVIWLTCCDIPRSTFNGCLKLSRFEMKRAISKIGTCAFFNCKSLKKMHVICDHLSVEINSFSGCISLQEISVSCVNSRKKSIRVPDTVSISYYYMQYKIRLELVVLIFLTDKLDIIKNGYYTKNSMDTCVSKHPREYDHALEFVSSHNASKFKEYSCIDDAIFALCEIFLSRSKLSIKMTKVYNSLAINYNSILKEAIRLDSS